MIDFDGYATIILGFGPSHGKWLSMTTTKNNIRCDGEGTTVVDSITNLIKDYEMKREWKKIINEKTLTFTIEQVPSKSVEEA